MFKLKVMREFMPTGFGELEAAQKIKKGFKDAQTLNTKQADIYTTAYDESMLPKELECCYNEFMFYKNTKNEIAALGWAVSYNLQVLWQNSPKIDTIDTNALQHTSIQGQTKPTNPREQQHFAEIQNFLKSHGIEPLTLRYTLYPRDTESQQEKELRQRAEKYSHYGNAAHTPRDHKRPIRFYTTLDWDRFYMKFPLIQRLSKEYLDNKEHIYSKAFKIQIHKTFLHNTNIMTILKQLPKGEHKLYFAIDVRDNRSDKNIDSYILVKENESIPQGYKLISACEPYEIDTLNFQVSSFADKDFFKQAGVNAFITIGIQFSVDTLAAFTLKRAGNTLPVIGQGLLVYEVYDTGKNFSQQAWNETMRDLSLYACSGKFSINYAPTCITIKKDIQDNKEKLEYRIDEMVAYVYDSFDFLDQYHIFNDDGTISKLGQPVGAWDFEEKAFSIWGSIRQMATYQPERFSYLKIDIGSSFNVELSDILQSPQTNQYYIYNQDYQDYQKFTPYGLDFRLYSKDIIKTLDFKDLPFETLYSTIG